MTPLFNELFAYNRHCNQRLVEVFEREPVRVDSKAIAVFGHILSAHHIWNQRILDKKTEYGVWHNHAIDTFATLDQLNHKETQHILDTYDLAGSTTYRNTTGKPFANTVKDMLFHIINHSTYHRGQIASLFRESGIEPLVTDYIHYKR